MNPLEAEIVVHEFFDLTPSDMYYAAVPGKINGAFLSFE
jgi:hypothetical protein